MKTRPRMCGSRTLFALSSVLIVVTDVRAQDAAAFVPLDAVTVTATRGTARAFVDVRL